MKLWLSFLVFVLFMACSESSKKEREKQREEAFPAIGTVSECKRAKEIQGSNSVFSWVKAPPGNLQTIVIDSQSKKIIYEEATNNGLYKGETNYRYAQSRLFFNTKSKKLRLTFPQKETAVVESDEERKEYVVSVLTYDDESGFHDPFLCPLRGI